MDFGEKQILRAVPMVAAVAWTLGTADVAAKSEAYWLSINAAAAATAEMREEEGKEKVKKQNRSQLPPATIITCGYIDDVYNIYMLNTGTNSSIWSR